MELAAIPAICNTCLNCWNCVAKYGKCIPSLGDNLNALKSKVDELAGVYDDVNRRVGAAEAEGWARNSDVDGWLKKVDTLKRETSKILEDGGKILERKCLCGLCFWNCRPRYKQSCLAKDKKADVEEALNRGLTFKVKEDVAYKPADLILERSVQAFRLKMDELRDFFETVKQQVESEKKRYQKPTPQVDGWLKRVEDLLEKQAREVLEKGKLELEKSRQRVEGDSQGERNSSYICISKSIDETRDILEGMLTQGRGFTTFSGFTAFTRKPDEPMMLEIPSERPVGADSVFKEIWHWVEDENVSCIGLFGMGGVGKTTLLNRVYNQLCRGSHDYNFALRIVVSRPANLDGIQEAILKELKLPEDQWNDRDRTWRASLIYKLMKKKDFLLFLDDLWDPIDLVNVIGIPNCRDHPKKCKIIFTTRDERVCDGMQSNKKKKVECLPPIEALQLFRQKLGQETWDAHPGIPEIAASIVRECQCLPIALITVARAMSGTTDLTYWEDAKNYLKSQMSKFKDMSEKVLANLEFSYQNLRSETHQKCFLYLSIFPEDHKIKEHYAINLWIGEGFLDDSKDVHKAHSYGEQIFRRLQQACLVESAGHSALTGEEHFKMHDVIREMALWVDSEHGSKTNTILVQENLGSLKPKELKKYDEAKRMCLWGSRCTSLAGISCSHLSTLIMRNTDLLRTPDDFFLSMPCLEVLDLSYNDHQGTLPNSIWKLTKLRYLNLDFTPSEMAFLEQILVPVEIKNLNKLEVLILSGEFLIPNDVLSSLSSVRVFHWSMHLTSDKREVLEELLKMQSVEEISIDLSSQENVKMFMGCKYLHSRLRTLRLFAVYALDLLRISTSSVRRLEHLSLLALYCCDISKIEIASEDNGSDDSPGYSYVEFLAPKPSSFVSPDSFSSLRDVIISSCNKLVDVTSLIVHAPTLKMLRIEACSSLKEVIVGDIENISTTTDGIFPSLVHLELIWLRSLERICRTALPFPSLKKIEVVKCSKLKKLPFNSDSAKSLQAIQGEKEWLEELEWDDPIAKQVFSPKFEGFSYDKESNDEDLDDEDSDDEDSN